MVGMTRDELQRLVRLVRSARKAINPGMVRAREIAARRLAEELAREYGLPDRAALVDQYDGDRRAPTLMADLFACLGERRD
jgi:hypothetical protein